MNHEKKDRTATDFVFVFGGKPKEKAKLWPPEELRLPSLDVLERLSRASEPERPEDPGSAKDMLVDMDVGRKNSSLGEKLLDRKQRNMLKSEYEQE